MKLDESFDDQSARRVSEELIESVYATCFDPKYPPKAIISETNSFFSCTGSLPHFLIVKFTKPLALVKLQIFSTDVKLLSIYIGAMHAVKNDIVYSHFCDQEYSDEMRQELMQDKLFQFSSKLPRCMSLKIVFNKAVLNFMAIHQIRLWADYDRSSSNSGHTMSDLRKQIGRQLDDLTILKSSAIVD